MDSICKDLLELVNNALGIFRADTLSDCNQRFQCLFNCETHEIIGKNFLDLSPEYQADGGTSAGSIIAIKRTVEKHGSHAFEWQFSRSDRSTFSAEVNFARFGDSPDIAILATITDITEQKQAEEDKVRIEAQYRQSQKVEAIGRLAGGVAHDLNNMLSPIIGYSELLIHDIGSNNKREEFALQIVQAGHRARDLVHQLLAFGRKQTLEYKTIDLNEIILRFENLLRRTIREDIELEFLLSQDSRSINADAGQIEQVIMNLCVNAQDAMPKGGKLTLATSLSESVQTAPGKRSITQADSHVLLSIKDTGSGMDSDIKEHIFEPFFSTKGEQGTGLGLSTVYGIVKQHEGDIWVDSNPGGGTVFNIYLPVTASTISDDSRITETTHSPTGTENILLVEDNEQVRELNKLILTQHGYSVQAAVDGADALRIITKGQDAFTLLLNDVVMPGINGRQLYLKVSEQIPDIKVIYMSGYADDVIAHHGVLDEGIHFIQKPFSIDALTSKVREVIDTN